ncbi:hypothetical protein F444_09001 [Phytophthora nicotianae P1976]|uniref:DUF6570 domain-containing protein n=1 Tax=Phytophthora nicotianae P1976 TaxID=1317066 RepID=A0A081A937_PHYNI|nr:hypothetical protein F444_09001 [Phytophthora nicotianae P1976]
MAKRLKSPQGLHEELLMCYDVSSQIPALKGALLSPMGINNGGRELYVCKPCFNSLMNKKLRSPPKFAIANGLYIGLLPEEYMDTNATEHAMLGLAQSTRMLTVVRGGNHSAIRAHAYYFRAVPSTPASLLPREVISDGTIGVTMIGSMTPQQKAATFKQYNVRVPRLISLLEWYRSNNCVFNAVRVNDNIIRGADTAQTQVVLGRSNQPADASAVTASDGLDSTCVRFNAPEPTLSEREA